MPSAVVLVQRACESGGSHGKGAATSYNTSVYTTLFVYNPIHWTTYLTSPTAHSPPFIYYVEDIAWEVRLIMQDVQVRA